jgi:hypothetical protein
MGFMGVIITPHLHMVQKQEVKKVAKEMSLDFTAQRMRAISTSGTDYRIGLIQDPISLNYYGYVLTPANMMSSGKRDKNIQNPTRINITMQPSPAGIALTTSLIRFDKYGYLLDGSGNTLKELIITIEDDGEKAVINYNGITGNYNIN